MAKIERLWTNPEIKAMGDTIPLLRRMRESITIDKSSISFKFRAGFSSIFGSKDFEYKPQESLQHATELTEAAAIFLAGKLTHQTKDNRANFQKWEGLLHDKEKQYKLYSPVTFAKTSTFEVLGNLMINRLRSLDIDPEYMIRWDLCVNNDLGFNPDENILDWESDSIGVVSPLSGDYLMASIYSHYLKNKFKKTFPVHVTAIDKRLSQVVFPQNTLGEYPFSNMKEIGIYIDSTATGATSKALFRSVQKIYPGKTIYEPTYQRSVAAPSKKIEKFWDKHLLK